MRRIILATAMTVVMAVSASVATFVMTNPAWANSSITCHKLTGEVSGGSKFHLQMCRPASSERTLSGAGIQLTRVGGPTTYTWKWNDGATTVVSLTVVQSGTCPKGYIAYTDTGMVTGGTSAQTGDAIQMDVCKLNSARYMYELRLPVGSVVSL